MTDYKKIPTSAEVCAVIRARHAIDLFIFSTFSDRDGTFNGGPGERGRMDTSLGFKDCDVPLIEYRTTWDIDVGKPHQHFNEKHEYWLCIAKNED